MSTLCEQGVNLAIDVAISIIIVIFVDVASSSLAEIDLGGELLEFGFECGDTCFGQISSDALDFSRASFDLE